MAIHSLKDVPSIIPEGLTLGCIPDREVPFDAYISKNHTPLSELPEGSIVGKAHYVVVHKFFPSIHI